MADITSKCVVRGQSQSTERPFDWHVWDIEVPLAAWTGGTTVDRVTMQETFDSETRIIAACAQVNLAGSSANTLLADFTMGLVTLPVGNPIVDTDFSGTASFFSTVNCLLTTAPQDTAVSSSIGAFGTGVTPGTNRRALRVGFTPGVSGPTTGLRMLVGLLMGRSKY